MKQQVVLTFLIFASLLLVSRVGYSQATIGTDSEPILVETNYEAESAILSGNASKLAAEGLSGGYKVGDIHGDASVTFQVTVGMSGVYDVAVSYCSADETRSISISPNDEPPNVMNAPSTGDWNVPGTMKFPLTLRTGKNTLIVSGTESGHCPDIDKILIPAKPAQSFAMSFGQRHSIVYDRATFKYDVIFDGVRVVSDAIAVVKNGESLIKSTDYTSATISSVPINDGLGVGSKHVVSLASPGKPIMRQVFYTYAMRSFFFTEVELIGADLKSDYMSPLSSATANIQSSSDPRTLFVPFDNDAWITYDAKSMSSSVTNISSEVGAVYDNATRKGLVVGSVEQSLWKTGIKTVGAGGNLSELTAFGGFAEESVTRDKKSHGEIDGASLKSPRIFVSYGSDFRIALEDYAQSVAIREPRYLHAWTKGTPFGWNSWGVIQSKISFDKVKLVADFFAEEIPTFRNDDTAYIDIDSYWENLSSDGVTGDFQQLTEFADYCKSKGLQPGIYWAPFVDWIKEPRPVEGSQYNYTEIWTKVNNSYHDFAGCRAIDPTHPGTRKRIDYLISKFKACGFTMIKIDFIGHAAIEADSYFDPAVKTGMQAFHHGMQHLIDQLGGQMLVSVAISPSIASGRYAHIRRIACDAMSSIENTENTLNSTSYGWWQSHIYPFLDADHIVFGNEPEGVNRARLTSALVTGCLTLGDDFSNSGPWESRIKEYAQNQELLDISRGKAAFRPVEANTGKGASDLYVRQNEHELHLAIVNCSKDSKNFDVSLERIGLSANDSYLVKELYSGESSTIHESLQTIVPAADAKIFRMTKSSPANE